MIVNKYKIVLPENDQYLNIPLEMNWDFLGRDDSIEVYQETMVKEVVGGVNDFEVLQFLSECAVEERGVEPEAFRQFGDVHGVCRLVV